jgi:hypothetical protein
MRIRRGLHLFHMERGCGREEVFVVEMRVFLGEAHGVWVDFTEILK